MKSLAKFQTFIIIHHWIRGLAQRSWIPSMRPNPRIIARGAQIIRAESRDMRGRVTQAMYTRIFVPRIRVYMRRIKIARARARAYTQRRARAHLSYVSCGGGE